MGDQQAAHALARAGVVDDVTGFHAQQTVEKSAKAVLALAGVPIPHTHDLRRLLALAADTDWPPTSDVVDAGWLTPWAVQLRYDEVTEPLDQQGALAVADAALRWAVETMDRA